MKTEDQTQKHKLISEIDKLYHFGEFDFKSDEEKLFNDKKAYDVLIRLIKNYLNSDEKWVEYIAKNHGFNNVVKSSELIKLLTKEREDLSNRSIIYIMFFRSIGAILNTNINQISIDEIETVVDDLSVFILRI